MKNATKPSADAQKETVKPLIGEIKKEENIVIPAEKKQESTEALLMKIKPLTAEERIERSERFEALKKRYKTLKQKWNDLKTFEAGNDKMSAKIVFQNQQGFQFEIQNTEVIKNLTECATNQLDRILTECENEVINFEM